MKNSRQNSITAPTAQMVRLGDGAYITVMMNGESLTLRASESQLNFDNALQALRNKDWDALYQAMRPVKSFAHKVDGITVNENGVFWNGEPLHNAVAIRIMDFALAGLDHKPLCKFLGKLMLNPSMRAVKELYTFLEHQNLPITDNGNILAYKGVHKNWYSITSGSAKLINGTTLNGQIFNGVGEEIEMARCDVDDDKDRGCSYGLHAGTMEYATDFGRNGRVVIVEINPKDVVSIPTDCSFQKLRTCAYKVVGEYEGALDKPLYESNYQTEDDLGDFCECGRNLSDETCECDDAFDCYCNLDSQTELELDVETADIKIFTPDSTWIDGVAYFEDGGYMVLFKLEGDDIVYKGVPRSLAENFENHVSNGNSAGYFYNRFVKGQYDLVD
jgi:hypothetical protein